MIVEAIGLRVAQLKTDGAVHLGSLKIAKGCIGILLEYESGRGVDDQALCTAADGNTYSLKAGAIVQLNNGRYEVYSDELEYEDSAGQFEVRIRIEASAG